MIQVNNLSVKYEKKLSLDEVSHQFPAGKVTCVIGENGSGKSTLLKSIMQIIPYSGEVLYETLDLSEMNREKRARKIAYLPQVRPLPHIDVKTLVSHGRFPYLGMSRITSKEDKELINSVMDALSLNSFSDMDVASLSGGERQRVYVAMAMVQDTEVIILDEPLTYMDIRHQAEIVKILKSLNSSGKTIIYTCHDLPQAFTFADEIVLLDKGKLIASGSREEVIKSGSIKKVFGMDIVSENSPDSYYSYKMTRKQD